MAVSSLDENGKLLAAIMPIALAEGSEDAEVEAGKAVCSEKGFTDKNTIRFAVNCEQIFFFLTDPSMILHHDTASYIHKMGWHPLLAASAAHSEHNSRVMSGLGSILRSTDFVLRRG